MKWKIYHKDAVQCEFLMIADVKVFWIQWKRSNRQWQMGPIFLQFPCSPLCPLCPALIVQPSLSSSLTAMCVGAGVVIRLYISPRSPWFYPPPAHYNCLQVQRTHNCRITIVRLRALLGDEKLRRPIYKFINRRLIYC